MSEQPIKSDDDQGKGTRLIVGLLVAGALIGTVWFAAGDDIAANLWRCNTPMHYFQNLTWCVAYSATHPQHPHHR